MSEEKRIALEFTTSSSSSSPCAAAPNVTPAKSGARKLTPTGVTLLGLSGALVVGFYTVVTPFLSPALRKVCLPFVPATKNQLRNLGQVLKRRQRGGGGARGHPSHPHLAVGGRSSGGGGPSPSNELFRGSSLLDIGSGDGRIVLQAAKQGFQATGVEINLWLVFYSRYKAYRLGLHRQTRFIKQDLWKTDLSKYDNIVVFGVEQMMQPLKEKLGREMRGHMWVVACRFPFPNWEPAFTLGTGIDTTWVYTCPPPSHS